MKMTTYTPAQLKRLHEIEVDILKEIERVCCVLDIQYFADWGTLLGAVRHHGFIPWDDDIDVCMIRKDYDKFIAEAPSVLKKGYTLQHYLVDSNTPTYQAKVRKDGTQFVEDYVKQMPIHQGIFVDIFPYDNTADNAEERKKHEKEARIARHLFVSKSVSQATNEKDSIKRCAFNILRKVTHLALVPISKKSLYKRLDYAMQKYNIYKTRYIHCCADNVQKIEDVFPLVELPFENTTIFAPHNWNAFLWSEFGDYVQLPPKDQRYTHRPKILDLGE